MSARGRAARRDQNEAAIVKALRQVGALVQPLSGEGVADLLVLFRKRLVLMEIKSAKGRATLAQGKRSQEGWPVVTIRTIDEALLALELIYEL